MVGAEERRDALVAQLFQGTIGFMDVVGVHIGDLGISEGLARFGPRTSRVLAAEVTSARDWGKEMRK